MVGEELGVRCVGVGDDLDKLGLDYQHLLLSPAPPWLARNILSSRGEKGEDQEQEEPWRRNMKLKPGPDNLV